jgi:hypothetical protein
MMIGQHPDLLGLPELKLFCCPTMQALERSLPRFWIERGVAHRSPGLVRAVAEFLFGGQTEREIAAALGWLHARPRWTGADVFDRLLESVSPRIPVEKSPDNVANDTALTRMADAYPQARYLHLTRHPVTTLHSMLGHWQRTMPDVSPTDLPVSAIASWVDINWRVLRFTANLPAGRSLRLRAEDVLSNPDSKLQSIATWLGLSAEPPAIAAMRHPEASPFARPGPANSGIVGGHDPGFLADPIPRPITCPAEIERPGGWSAYEDLWRLATDLAARLGYADSRAS